MRRAQSDEHAADVGFVLHIVGHELQHDGIADALRCCDSSLRIGCDLFGRSGEPEGREKHF